MTRPVDDNIIDTPVGEEMRSSFLEYSMSVIVSRALPDVRDGLKPVHRRILFGMHEMGIRPGTPYKKCARTVGECFVRGALVSTPQGLVPVEDIRVGDQVLDGAGAVSSVVELFYNAPQPLFDVTTSAGRKVTVTPGQRFRTLDPSDFTLQWTRADALTEDTILLAPKGVAWEASADEESYCIGTLVAEGYQVDRRQAQRKFGVAMADAEPVEALEQYALEMGGQAKRSIRSFDPNEGRRDLYEAKVVGCESLYDACADYSGERIVPPAVMADTSKHAAFLAGYFDGDGHARAPERREVVFVSTSKDLLESVQVLLSYHGVHAHLAFVPASDERALEGRSDSYHLSATGEDATLLAEVIAPLSKIPSKQQALSNLVTREGRSWSSGTRRVPSSAVWAALNAAHLGGGWFRDADGNAFRSPVTSSGGKKLRISADRAERTLGYDTLKAGGFLAKLEKIGSPLASNLRTIVEGYRLLAVTAVGKSERVEETFDFQVDSESHEIVVDGVVHSNCMGKYHPHGDSAIYEAMVRMAQDFSMRLPLVDGHGNFGSLGNDDPPAAMRYCLTGDTLVRTPLGTLRIQDLAQAAPDSEVEIDLPVTDHTGRTVKASKFFHSGTHPVKRVRTSAGYELAGTHNHPVLCLESIAGVPTLQWRLLEEVKPGTVVAMARNEYDEESSVLSETERQLAVLAGGMVSEGWASSERIGFNNTDKTYFDEVLAAYDALVGGTRYVYSRVLPSGKTSWEMDVHNTAAFLTGPLSETVGFKAAEKSVPEFVWKSTKAFKRSFLQSLFTGDGSSSNLGRNTMQLSYSTRSQALARDVQELLLEFGIVSRRYDFASDEVKVCLTNRRDVRLFAERVGFLPVKQEKLLKELSTVPQTSRARSSDHIPFLADFIRTHAGRGGLEWLKKHNIDRVERWERDGDEIAAHIADAEVREVAERLVQHGYFYDTISSVIDEAPQPVYSIRVDTDAHSFVSGGFISHNTEARLAAAAMSMLTELSEDTVDFRPNYDGTEQEPEVLPASFPNLLVNGSTGIAVGMATNMAPHNLVEVIAALRHLLADDKASLDDLLQHVKGPDLPTGGIIIGADGIREAYETGRGSFRIRSTARIEDISARKKGIVVTELPYTIGPEKVITKIKELQSQKRLLGVSAVNDLSDRKVGTRLVIECKTGFNPAAVLEELYRLTPLEESFGVNNVCLVNSQPQTLGLMALCRHFLNHRIDVVTRRTKFRLRKDEARLHIVDGLLIALAAIDEVVAVIRSSKDTETARKKLQKEFKLSEIQANHILEMPLRRLTSLEVTKLKDEAKELKRRIAEYKKLLSSEKDMKALVSDELQQMSDLYGNPRRSKLLAIAPDPAQATASLEIADDPCVVTLSSSGLIARSEMSDGKPVVFKGKHGKHDAVISTLATTNRSVIGGITSGGKLLRISVVELPQAQGKNRGGSAREFFVDLDPSEQIISLVSLPDPKSAAAKESVGIALATAQGTVKRITPDLYPTKSGQEIIGLKDGDVLVGAMPLVSEESDLILVTSGAQLLRTPAKTIRPQGRTAAGVAGMKVGDAKVIAFGVYDPSMEDKAVLATVTNAGSAKVTTLSEYPQKGRGGAGVRCHTLRKGEDHLVAAFAGEGTPIGMTAGSDPVPLPAERSRRDASGSDRLEGDVVTIAAARR